MGLWSAAKGWDLRPKAMSTATQHARQSLQPPRGLSAVLDYAGASHRRARHWLIVFCLIAFLPGFFQIPPVDRDEARFAQATKQMLESGEYVDIRFQDEVRYKKPVGIYWLQAAGGESGRGASASRRRAPPSGSTGCRRCLRAIGAVLLTYWTALAFVGAPRRAAGGADDGEFASCSASRRGSPRPTRRCCSPASRRWARWRASI